MEHPRMMNQEQDVSPVDALHARIERDFTYHAPTPEMATAFVDIRVLTKKLAHTLVDLVPTGRELSTALTKLEEAVMHANAGIARAGRTARE